MSTVDANRSDNWFVRAAATIGDLGNPFYAEERQRDVWNEASAVALQVLIWLHLLAATAMVWIVGADAMPYVYAVIVTIGLAGWVAFLYSASLGVHVETRTQTSWRRVVPLLVVVAFLAAGLVRAGVVQVSNAAGMVTGAAMALGLLWGVARFVRSRNRGDERD